MRVAIFKRPPRAQFLTKSKNLSYGRSKFGPKSWHFLPRFYTNLSLFLAFTVFTSIVYFFWSFPFKPFPEGRIFEGGLLQLGSRFFRRQTSLWLQEYISITWSREVKKRPHRLSGLWGRDESESVKLWRVARGLQSLTAHARIVT